MLLLKIALGFCIIQTTHERPTRAIKPVFADFIKDNCNIRKKSKSSCTVKTTLEDKLT